MPEIENLKKQLADMTLQRDEALARADKFARLFDADVERYHSLIFRLGDESIGDALDDRDNLRNRLTGNMAGRIHLSDKLQELRQMADEIWSNVDFNDPASHPANNVAETKLINRGWSASLAKAGASIIRPNMAHKGRPKEKE